VSAIDHGAPFISHSSLNNDKAIEVRDWLAKNGWDDVFLDLDPVRGIAAGQRWKEALQKAAWRCEVVLALVSEEWIASSWCKSEVDAARMMGKKVIAALVGIDKTQVPPDLTDEQYVDLTGAPDVVVGTKAAIVASQSFARCPFCVACTACAIAAILTRPGLESDLWSKLRSPRGPSGSKDSPCADCQRSLH
jgi:hypothetical protein